MATTEKETKEKVEKSQRLAAILEMVKIYFHQVDLDYAKQMVIEFRNQASFQRSASVINIQHNHIKDDLLNEQANSLDHLIKCIEGLIKCDKLKQQIKDTNEQREKINKLFI